MPYDFLCKPVDYVRLMKALDDLAESFTQRSQIRDLEDKLLDNLLFHGIVGRSPAMLEVFDLTKKIARHYTNALITGPPGSGKELIARALHQMSPVAKERFTVCNCSGSYAARKPAFWPRARLFHRRHGDASQPFRIRRWRHRFPRRNWGNVSAYASKVTAGD